MTFTQTDGKKNRHQEDISLGWQKDTVKVRKTQLDSLKDFGQVGIRIIEEETVKMLCKVRK